MKFVGDAAVAARVSFVVFGKGRLSVMVMSNPVASLTDTPQIEVYAC